MKGLACGKCVDLRALPQGDYKPVSCRCGNVTAWWIDGSKGIARFVALDVVTAYGIGLNNRYLMAALDQGDMVVPDEQWRKLHDDACAAPGYLFDASRRGCWALIFRPGTTSDTAWASDEEKQVMIDAGLLPVQEVG